VPIFRWEVGLPTRTMRTIGASIVLFGLVVSAVIQMGSDAEADTAQTEVAESPLDNTVPGSSQVTTTSLDAEPFVYRIGVLSGMTTDNFWAYYGAEPSVWNSYILGPTKPALFSVDTVNGSVEPELATAMSSPTWDADGWRVRVELNPDFRWSDGEPITADDFVFTYETVRALGLDGSWATAFGDTVESVHADGDHLLRIEFAERPNLGVWPHGVGLAPVMAKHVWSDVVDGSKTSDLYAQSGARDVSGGPLTLVDSRDSLIVSHANPGYPLGSGPATVEYHVYGSESEMIDAMADGEIDTTLSPKGISTETLEAIDLESGMSLLTSPANSVHYVGFNLTRAPMSDQAFRTALALLVDRDGLADTLSVGEPAWSLLPAANTRWFDASDVEGNAAHYRGTLPDRLDRALETLKTAGYEWKTDPSVGDDGRLVAGKGLTIDSVTPQPVTILTPGDAYDPAGLGYADAIGKTLGVLGFDARPVETDFDTVVDLTFTADEDGAYRYDMYVLGWTLGSPALPGYYRPLFSKKGEENNTGYVSKRFETALADYEGAYTIEEARDALWAMENTLSDDLPYLPLYTSQLNEVYRSDRVGFKVTESLGGLQARLGGIADVHPTG
jgi:peptide/nickel transport system substrate-binding protein